MARVWNSVQKVFSKWSGWKPPFQKKWGGPYPVAKSRVWGCFFSFFGGTFCYRPGGALQPSGDVFTLVIFMLELERFVGIWGFFVNFIVLKEENLLRSDYILVATPHGVSCRASAHRPSPMLTTSFLLLSDLISAQKQTNWRRQKTQTCWGADLSQIGQTHLFKNKRGESTWDLAKQRKIPRFAGVSI